MKVYRVGGCVRDRLLGLPVNDIDWVVTGATAKQMQVAGYKAIGKDSRSSCTPKASRNTRWLAPSAKRRRVTKDSRSAPTRQPRSSRTCYVVI